MLIYNINIITLFVLYTIMIVVMQLKDNKQGLTVREQILSASAVGIILISLFIVI